MMSPNPNSVPLAVRLRVRGQIQGVGFRPFVARLAYDLNLAGEVRNDTAGAIIELEGSEHCIAAFQVRLTDELPPPAAITEVYLEYLEAGNRTNFIIAESTSHSGLAALIPRDSKLCANCQREIFDSADRRHCYPFTNCTVCGPRYSIIERMPYDRSNISMRVFIPCPDCHGEYTTPSNRRFYAQPNACHACGPRLSLTDPHGTEIESSDGSISAAVKILREGHILALKGLGGFQLLVRADDTCAIARLRERKHRPTKPLAVMVRSLQDAEAVAVLSDVEREVLQSLQNPIVILEQHPDAGNTIAVDGIAPGTNTIGLFLPTTPLHALILGALDMPLVVTSGNIHGEPIITNDAEAYRGLSDIVDAILSNNRPIVHRVDDSVVRVIDEQPVTLRLARGYAPLPLTGLDRFSCPPVLAVGGHQNNAIALWNGSQAVLAPHLGELDHPSSRTAFAEGIEDLCRLYDCQPQVIACDQHPDYFSTQWANQQGVQIITVQHHHAHAAAAMLEHNLLDEEVLAILWDGTGYGTDGTAWGGEFLRANVRNFDRIASLRPFPLPGGEVAIRHPNRIAYGMLQVMSGTAVEMELSQWRERLGIAPGKANAISQMIQRGIHTPWSCSVGRLFDAIAALVLSLKDVSYEGEAAVRWEALSDRTHRDAYELPTLANNPSGIGELHCLRGDWSVMLRQILHDLHNKISPRIISARFHNALVQWAVDVVKRSSNTKIVLGGGCFQNRLLTERIAKELRRIGRQVFTPGVIPPGDGGLAAGQLAVALSRLTPVK